MNDLDSPLDGLIYTERAMGRSEKQALEGFDPKHRNIVDYIIGITYDIWENKGIGEIHDTYADDVFMHVGLSTHHGRQGVVAGTMDTLQVFPDRIPYGEEVIWSRAGGGKFFSSHRLGSTATHLGHHEIYGNPTGKRIFFRTMADCTIADNRIDEEWLVRDNYHIIRQLGLDPIHLAKRSNPYSGDSGGSVDDKRSPRPENAVPRFSIADYKDGYRPDSREDRFEEHEGRSSAALILSLFKTVLHDGFFNRLDEYYAETALLHSICERRYNGIREIRDYLTGFLAPLPRRNIVLDRITWNTGPGDSRYRRDKAAVRWTITGLHRNHGLFGAPSGKSIHIVGITHFEIADGRIHEQWDVFDVFDVLCQIHAAAHAELPPRVQSPGRSWAAAQNRLTGDTPMRGKKTVLSLVESMNNRSPGQDPRPLLSRFISEDLIFSASRPLEETAGLDAYADEFLRPFQQAFPDVEDQPYLVMGESRDDDECVSIAGNLIGTFEGEWLGIPPSRQCVRIRYQSHMLLEEGKIVKAWYLFDILDLLRQAGFDLFPGRGADFAVPPPMSGDGIITYPADSGETEITRRLVSDMLNALCDYDGEDYSSMGDLGRYWDERNMMWYGPAGIGSTRGLKGFQKYHQFPFLTAFPNRGIIAKTDADHFASYAEGSYACDFGFPSMYASHTGSGWLGLEATGKECTMRVMDFWRREGPRLKENWVMIDLIDVLEQLGIDVFQLLRDAVK